jgi:hypothetical protein
MEWPFQPCCRKVLIGFLVGRLLAVSLAIAGDDYARRSVAELIDDLTQIDSQAPGMDTLALYQRFIADDTPESFEMGILGAPPAKVPPQMRELVRRGPVALPELIRHLDDKRPTRFEVGNKPSQDNADFLFMFMAFSDEYDPRPPHWFREGELTEESKNPPPPGVRSFEGTYTVKVADVCYVLIGQIVNRRLLAVRYQPTGGLIVNSPIEVPVLAEKVRSGWGNVDAEGLKASLLEDIHATNQPKGMGRAQYTNRFVDPALARLRFYFPETYRSLKGDDLRKKTEFEKTRSPVGEEVVTVLSYRLLFRAENWWAQSTCGYSPASIRERGSR